MATNAQPMPDQQPQGAAAPQDSGSAQQGGPQGGMQPGGPSMQAPANPLQMLLARWYQMSKQMGQSDPRLASGAEKVSQGIQEMQTALVSQSQSMPAAQQPQY